MDSNVLIGWECSNVVDVQTQLRNAQASEMDFTVIPLFHPRYRRDSINVSKQRISPATRSDRELECKQWQSVVIGTVSPWIDLDNQDLSIRSSSQICLQQEIMWSSHLCLHAILLPSPKMNCPNYARSILQHCSYNSFLQIWIRIPIFGNANQNGVDDGWQLWDNIRNLCGHTHRICVALEIVDNMGEMSSESLLFQRWASEPVKAIILNTNTFVINKAGYPVLNKSLQRQLEFFFSLQGCRLILSGKSRHLSGEKTTNYGYRSDFKMYTQYLRHLKARFITTNKTLNDDRYTIAYRDTLQAPLQPLMDNLEAQTYETFERDPIKYERYEAAITSALTDIRSQRKSLLIADDVNDTVADDRYFVVTVVGAGRGPLVAAVLSAACSAEVSIRVYAVEKNPNAVITLRNRVHTELWTNVTVVDCDMRVWVPPEQCDIMVSELLGSFGDNELSPECLDGAQKCLKPGGISIPTSYTSFIAPISAPRLWKCASEMLEGRGLDTPFVVKLHSFFQCADAVSVFHFSHPNKSSPESAVDNSRFKTMTFLVPVNVTIHGLAGYFESVLYKDIKLSILPTTHTPGMFSWFPLFIPSSMPLHVKEGELFSANIWRCVDSHRVWYEWSFSGPVVTPIQNSCGKSYHIGL